MNEKTVLALDRALEFHRVARSLGAIAQGASDAVWPCAFAHLQALEFALRALLNVDGLPAPDERSASGMYAAFSDNARGLLHLKMSRLDHVNLFDEHDTLNGTLAQIEQSCKVYRELGSVSADTLNLSLLEDLTRLVIAACDRGK